MLAQCIAITEAILLLLVVTSISAGDAYSASTYEDKNLHVKLAYPSSWLVSHPTSAEGCMMIGVESPECFIEFRPNTSHNDVKFRVTQTSEQDCNCDNLVDYLKWSHQWTMAFGQNGVMKDIVVSDFRFLSDNQTTVGKDNNEAWKTQYLKTFTNTTDNTHHNITTLTWQTKVKDHFYDFILQLEVGSFDKYYPDAKSMVNSVQFPSERIPSFMSMSGDNKSLSESCNTHCLFESSFAEQIGVTKDTNENWAFMEIDSDTNWQGSVLDSSMKSETKAGSGEGTIPFECSSSGTYSLAMQKQTEGGSLHIKVVRNGNLLKDGSTTAPYGLVSLAGEC